MNPFAAWLWKLTWSLRAWRKGAGCGAILMQCLLLLTIMISLTGCYHPRPESSWDKPRLLEALASQDIETRELAAKYLGEQQAREAFWPLVKALGDSRWEVRHSAARALGQLGDQHAVVPLLKSLQDQHWWVRAQVVQSLGSLRSRRAVAPLRALLHDDNSSIRASAEAALEEIAQYPERRS